MKINILPDILPSILGVDIETDSLDEFNCTILLIGLSDGDETWILTEDFERVIPILENPHVLKIFHYYEFDGTVLGSHFSHHPQNIYDTQLVEGRILNNGLNTDNDLKSVLARRLSVILDKEVRETFADHSGPITQEQLDYLERDVKYLLPLRESQLKDIYQDKLDTIVNLENRLRPIVLDMRLTGLGFDRDKKEEVFTQVAETLGALEEQMRQVVGEDFYIDQPHKSIKGDWTERIELQDIKWGSHHQLKTTLHTLGIKVPNTQAATLEIYQDKHPLIPLILEWKLWNKMVGYHWDEAIHSDGRVHPKWNQIGTITGRFTATDPAMQTIPRPVPGKPHFRSLFRPVDNHVFLVLDYSQQEPRILAHVANDPKMIEAANNSDIYIAFAQDVWNETIDKKDPKRQLCKIGVLASFYGEWYKNLARLMHVSDKEAEEVQNKIFFTYKNAKGWGDYQIRGVKSYGYTQSVWGRRMYFPSITKKMEWKTAKEARNYPIQSTAADMCKLAMIKIDNIIQGGYDAHFVIALHDELAVSCHKDQAEELFPLMIKAMEEAGSEICPSVKFPVEGKISDVWEH